MGQKVHPLGFRLNTTQKHKSIWFAQLNQYSALLEQDEIIRNYIKTNYDSAGIADIESKDQYARHGQGWLCSGGKVLQLTKY